jgi:hypothetical protein
LLEKTEVSAPAVNGADIAAIKPHAAIAVVLNLFMVVSPFSIYLIYPAKTKHFAYAIL